MSATYAALKGKLGTTEYYVLTMKAKALVEKALIPMEIDGWENLKLEEREQRDLNYKRVKTQIAPYLVEDKDRFFGALIVAARNFDPKNFEGINRLVPRDTLPRLYESEGKLMGFLTLDGGEELIPLDGQHRLKALKFAIEGVDEKNKKIEGLKPDSNLSKEEITVILIPYDLSKARKIFTKVNRYAKPTTTGQNLVTDDNDIIAVLARGIANNMDIIGPDLVKYTSNSLTDRDGYFTTLATIAECNDIIIAESFGDKVDRQTLPERGKVALYEVEVNKVWGHLVSNVDLFSDMLKDKTSDGNERRVELRKEYLLGKPIPQVCLVSAFARLTNLADGKSLTYKEVTDKINAIRWTKDDNLWDRLLISGSKILHKNQRITADILCYMMGEPLNGDEKTSLLERYKALFPEEEKGKIKLPDKV